MTDAHDEPRPGQADEDDDRFAVLEVFGLKLEVSNPRLAELLTLDAADALTSDVRDLKDPEVMREARVQAREALSDGILAPETIGDGLDAKRREAMREEIAGLGERMGFITHLDGVWESPTGAVILCRVIGEGMSFDLASKFVRQMAERRSGHTGQDSTVLFVAPGQQAADVFKVAIRQGHFHHAMRTVSTENLREMTRMFGTSILDHGQVVILLAPVADIDVGEVLSVIRSATGSGE